MPIEFTLLGSIAVAVLSAVTFFVGYLVASMRSHHDNSHELTEMVFDFDNREFKLPDGGETYWDRLESESED